MSAHRPFGLSPRHVDIVEGDPRLNHNGARASKVVARTLPLRCVPKDNDPFLNLPSDSQPMGELPRWFRHDVDMSDDWRWIGADMGYSPSPYAAANPDLRTAPAQARRQPLAYWIAIALLSGILLGLVALWVYLDALERMLPGAVPPLHPAAIVRSVLI